MPTPVQDFQKDQEASWRIVTLRIQDGIQDGTCFENKDVSHAKETTVRRQLPSRGIQRLQRHLQVRATLSLGQGTPHPRPNSNPPKQHLARWSGAHTTGTDGHGTALEPCPFRDTANFRGKLTTSFTKSGSEPFFGRIRTDAHNKPAQTSITAEKTPLNALCSLRTVDHGSPDTR